MQTRPLTDAFGVIVEGVDLNAMDNAAFAALRALFEAHSLLVLPAQSMSDAAHLALARRFGPIEDRNAADLKQQEDFKVPEVSNILEDGTTLPEDDLRALDLRANMQWHCDSTFLPVPALTNILAARVIAATGGNTEFASTRAAFAALPEDRKAALRATFLRHNAWHSRARLSPELAASEKFHKWPEQCWRAVWRNPVNGREALYIASHAFAVQGMDGGDGQDVIDDLMAHATQPAFTYAHAWREGDVLIWDQRAVLHRATPWNYAQARKLSSICVSATAQDGVDAMRPM